MALITVTKKTRLRARVSRCGFITVPSERGEKRGRSITPSMVTFEAYVVILRAALFL